MEFSSLFFVFVFFPAFFLTYYAVYLTQKLIARKRGTAEVSTTPRNIVLLCFSLFFYAWGEIRCMWLIIFSILFNWLFAIFISKSKSKGAKQLWLVLDVTLNLGLLVFYKYAGFFTRTFNLLPFPDVPVVNVMLPIGISFFTFQIMSYVIDVYRNEVEAKKSPFIVALYLSAFPQLIAGPIVRYSDVEKQLVCRKETLEKVSAGLHRFIYGLAKKILIANSMAGAVDYLVGKSDPTEYGMLGAWLIAIAYSLQIYFDFSGYSDMAIGMGKMMGFDYLENFIYPYSATSVTDFWRRWHISLSGFFRDYVYIPMGGNRVSTPRWIFNILTVWFLTGLWHGAAFNFIIWGLYYGIILLLEKKLYAGFLKKHTIFARIYTILVFMIGWIIFRVEDMASLGRTLLAMVGGYGFVGNGGPGIWVVLQRAEISTFFIIIAIIGIVLSFAPRKKSLRRMIFAYDKISIFENETVPAKFKSFISILVDLLVAVLLVLCIIFLEAGSYNPSIYFAF